MKTVTILESFDGYPNGKKRSFVAGTEEELSDAYADLVEAKGLAREKPATRPDGANKSAPVKVADSKGDES